MWQKLKNENDEQSVHLTEWPEAKEVILKNMLILNYNVEIIVILDDGPNIDLLFILSNKSL